MANMLLLLTFCVRAPDSTFWLKTDLTCPYGKGRDWWSVSRVLEPEPRPVDGQAYPHLAIHLIDTKEAREDSILFSEFSALAFAMRGRANQRKVDSETEKWRLMENDGEGTEEYPYLFPNEEYFPVLLFSFVLPQHARILTACIVQEKLVIRQSKLYSFEWKKSAPIEFFSSPLPEPSFGDPGVSTTMSSTALFPRVFPYAVSAFTCVTITAYYRALDTSCFFVFIFFPYTNVKYLDFLFYAK